MLERSGLLMFTSWERKVLNLDYIQYSKLYLGNPSIEFLGVPLPSKHLRKNLNGSLKIIIGRKMQESAFHHCPFSESSS